MQQEQAMEFYDRLTQGTEYHKEISLEHESGGTLEGVQLYAVDKQRLARTIERLPDDMFDAVEGAEDAEAAEEQLEEEGGDLSAVTEGTVSAFEELVADSMEHEEFTNTQINRVVDELNFEVLFRLGTEIINMSVEETGSIQAFHEHE